MKKIYSLFNAVFQKNIFISLLLLFISAASFAQITIGPGTAVQRFPFNYYFGYGRDAAIYTANEMSTSTTSGTLTTLSWNSSIASSTVAPTVIYLKLVGTTAAVASDTWANTIAGATTVYTGTPSPWVVGWNQIDITDFAIPAGQNLEVLVECNTTGGGIDGSTSTQFTYTPSTANSHGYWQQDTNPPTGNPTRNTSRPDIILGGLMLTSCNVPGAVTVSGLTGTAATVNFTGASNAVVEYGPAGFTPGTGATAGTGGTIATGTSSPVTITGLSASTAYDVYVRQNCTAASLGYSANSAVTHFTTNPAGPANDDCTGAAVIACGAIVTGNNTTANNDALPGITCGSTTTTVGTNRGVWFTVTPQYAGPLTVAACGTSFDSYMRVYAGTCGAFTACKGYNDDGCGSASTVTFTATANTTYYVLLAGYGTTDYGAYTITATCPAACNVPGSVAIANITQNSANVTFTGGTGNYIVEYGPNGFTPGTGATAGTGGTIVTGTASPISLTGLTPVTGYDVYVRTDCSGSGSGYSPNSAVVSFTTNAPPPANDDCSTAIALPCDGTVTGDNSAATDDALPAVSCGSTFGGFSKGVWYTITPSYSGSLTISTCGTSFDDYLRVYEGSCGSLTTCTGYSDDVCGSQASLTFNAVANHKYFILLAGYSSASFGAYTITTSCPALCSAPSGVSAGAVTESSADISFTGTAGNYIVEYGPTGFTPGTDQTAGTGGTVIPATTSPVTITGLDPSTTYDVYVRQDCTGAGNGYSNNSIIVTFTTNAPPPANDDCATAIAIPCGGTLTGDNSSATDETLDPISCGSTISGYYKGVWYTVTPAYSGSLTVSSCGSSFDTYLRVYEGSCNAFTSCAGYNDDATCGGGFGQSTVTFNAVANHKYFILLAGYGSTDFGAFTINATCPALCSAPTGLSASAITVSSADISFTGAAGNYIVEYGPTGFTPGTDQNAGTNGIAVMATTSPVTITGLDPSTTYDVYVRQDCSGAGNGYSTNSAVLTFTTSAPPPVNDEATGAINLIVNAGCTGNPYNNIAATQSTNEPFPSCKGTAGYAGTWFKFVAPASGAVKISCDGTGTLGDSRLALFSAGDVNNYATFNIIACDDDNGVTNSTRSLFYDAGLTPGTTYYVEVDLYSSFSTRGNFCVTVDELSASMLATAAANCVTDQGSVGFYNAAYIGWVSLVDAAGNLNVNVRQNAGTATSFNSSRTINTGAPRMDGNGQPYLNRNFLVTAPGATSADLQLFFTDAELTNLGGTLANLNVSRVAGSTCNPNFTGTATLLPQTASGSANGADYVQVTTPGFSNFYIQKTAIVLPVSIEFFHGSKQGTANYLNWKVNCTSAPSLTLVLERSSDGRSFGSIQNQNATAIRCLQEFNFTDNDPLAGINYYRLKIITPDGAVRYSTIVALLNKDKGFELISVAPNPVKNSTILTVTTVKGGKMEINVSDVAGRQVSKQTVDVIAGNNTISMNFESLGAGTYNITAINADGDRKTTRFVKF